MIRIIFFAIALAITVVGPDYIKPVAHVPASGIGLTKVERVYVAHAVARFMDEH